MSLRRPKRIEGFPYKGLHRYLLTFCTEGRRTLFIKACIVENARLQFQRVAADEGFAISAYCFMPDHVHLAVEGIRDDSDLRRFVKMGKQRVAYALWRDHKLTNVWQEGYHDWVVRPDQEVTRVIEYVLNNPVRAGLVSKWDEYPFSGSSFRLV